MSDTGPDRGRQRTRPRGSRHHYALAVVILIVSGVAAGFLAISDRSEGNPASSERAPSEGKPARLTTAEQRAELYLELSSHSRTELITLLSDFEGLDIGAATQVVDSLDVDWNEQAVGKAEFFAELADRGRDDLIAMLVSSGFTREQAEHGADAMLGD